MIELAKNEEDKAVMTFLSADIPISRAFVTTPDTPPSASRRCAAPSTPP